MCDTGTDTEEESWEEKNKGRDCRKMDRQMRTDGQAGEDGWTVECFETCRTL